LIQLLKQTYYQSNLSFNKRFCSEPFSGLQQAQIIILGDSHSRTDYFPQWAWSLTICIK